MIKVVFVMLAINLMITSVCCCPLGVCICKWKGGKQTVECNERFLSRIPDTIDPGTQVLNFSGNSLQVLQSERFLKLKLTNLQKINLSRNQLIRIHDKSFRGLTNLIELDLSDNMLTTVPSETFQDYTSLMRLSLSGNAIRNLKTNAFRYLSYLTTLELSNCQIVSIEDDVFIGMDNLEWLRLDGNRITTIHGKNILPKSLHGINLQANRWTCDCELNDMHAWLINYNVPQTEEPTCMQPSRLAGQAIKYLIADELACIPDITLPMLHLEISEGRNVSLSCKINATPQATVSWMFQGQILQNDTMLTPNLHFYYLIEEGAELKHSELFIYNTNAENNGTFSCVAENSAGRAQANYTISVIIKNNPIVEEVVFPYDHFLVIVVGASIIALTLILIFCFLILQCRLKIVHGKENSNNQIIQHQLNPPKSSSIKAKNTKDILSTKSNCSLSGQHEIISFASNSLQSANIGSKLPVVSTHQFFYGPSMQNTSGQNPDLINDAKNGKGRPNIETDDAHSDHGSVGPTRLQGVQDAIFLPNYNPQNYSMIHGKPVSIGMPTDIHQHQVDVHLNPGCYLGLSNQPIDYRLQAKVPHFISHSTNSTNKFYRTLPHNRAVKINTAANPVLRFSVETDFLPQSATPTIDTYNNKKDLRHTIGGYPGIANDPASLQIQPLMKFVDSSYFPLPPEGYKGEISLPSVGLINTSIFHGQVLQQWPSCLPGYKAPMLATNSKTPSNEQSFLYNKTNSTFLLHPVLPISNRSIGALTSESKIIYKSLKDGKESLEESKLCHINGPLADSPDEGYVGDSQDGTDI